MKVNEKKSIILIIILTIVLPVAVVLLYLLPQVDIFSKGIIAFLPKLNALINSTTAFFLILAYIAIRNGEIEIHKKLMLFSLCLSIIFLVSYVLYHLSTESTKYPSDASLKGLYYFILISHIVLAVIIVPLVLLTFMRAINGNFEKHRKIAKWTLPLWLYVSITGVLVYFMISPYYI